MAGFRVFVVLLVVFVMMPAGISTGRDSRKAYIKSLRKLIKHQIKHAEKYYDYITPLHLSHYAGVNPALHPGLSKYPGSHHLHPVSSHLGSHLAAGSHLGSQFGFGSLNHGYTQVPSYSPYFSHPQLQYPTSYSHLPFPHTQSTTPYFQLQQIQQVHKVESSQQHTPVKSYQSESPAKTNNFQAPSVFVIDNDRGHPDGHRGVRVH